MPATTSIAATLVKATVDELRRYSPFDHMDEVHLTYLVERLRIAYFPAGEVVLSPNDGTIATFNIIKQGHIVGEPADGAMNVGWDLSEGECFPLAALLARRAVTSTYRASTDTFCYQLPIADFEHLLKVSPPFHEFCTRRIASLLAHSHRSTQAQYAQSHAAEQLFMTPLGKLLRREPVTCRSQDSIREALTIMRTARVGSIVILDDGCKPRGIFTLPDLRDRVALAGVDLTAPIGEVMTPDPVTLPAEALAHQAVLLMARHSFRHVVVTQDGCCRGVVSERDLFSMQRVGLSRLSADLRNAADLDALVQLSADIRSLSRSMIAQGVAPEQLTLLISELNDTLTRRVIELELATQLPPSRFCWLALGSEGRTEQTLTTDQDNGLIFVCAPGEESAIRVAWLPIARRINEALDACGFPLCKGGIMASNPLWCLSLEEWKQRFRAWIDQGDPTALLNASIFFDFRALCGERELAEALREWLTEQASANPRFLRQMAENALRNRPPLGLLRDFVTSGEGEDADTLDLKLNGTTPFVDAARIFALAQGVRATNTAERLRELARTGKLAEDDVDAWLEAFFFLQQLRLRNQDNPGSHSPNRIDPDKLEALDRRLLKESFRQARVVQSHLALDYHL